MKCGYLSISNQFIEREFGRDWVLNDVEVDYSPKTRLLNLELNTDCIFKSGHSLSEFKMACGQDLRVPVIIKFLFDYDYNPYGSTEQTFDDQLSCWFKETHYLVDKVILSFESIVGKELKINGNSTDGQQKPLFWASILKGNIH